MMPLAFPSMYHGFFKPNKAGGLAVALESVGYLHGYSGSKSPENITQLKQSNVCYLCGDAKTRVAYQGQNIRPADFAPTLLRTRPRKKGREPRIIFVVHVIISFVGLKFFTCVQVTAVLSGNV